nr:MAG TPA: hypothetical protein [Bacteriophage sp.]DAW21880.1 MAG TPA: hypothetical protein [Bacteriophage sp.]DAW87494.1 MAG TPA: hypothetical protein [Bacteriophage sp.]
MIRLELVKINLRSHTKSSFLKEYLVSRSAIFWR